MSYSFHKRLLMLIFIGFSEIMKRIWFVKNKKIFKIKNIPTDRLWLFLLCYGNYTNFFLAKTDILFDVPKYPCRSVISMKLLYYFIEIALQHECSLVNLLHNFRRPFS